MLIKEEEVDRSIPATAVKRRLLMLFQKCVWFADGGEGLRVNPEVGTSILFPHGSPCLSGAVEERASQAPGRR